MYTYSKPKTPNRKKAVALWSVGAVAVLAVFGAVTDTTPDKGPTESSTSLVETDLVELETSKNTLGVSFVDYHFHNTGDKEHNYKVVVDIVDKEGVRVSQINIYENDVRPDKGVKGSQHAPGVRDWSEYDLEVSEFKRTRWF